MDQQTLLIFLVLVFGAVFVLAQSIFVPTFGTEKQESKRLKKRLGAVAEAYASPDKVSLLREKYLRNLSPLERWLESLPGMENVETLIEQSGHAFPAYRMALLSLCLGLAGGVIVWVFTRQPIFALAFAGLVCAVPTLKLRFERNKRFEKFEEQLPDALDMMTRALRTGRPFTETLQVVATEMDAPIAREFQITFDEINYGTEVRWALRNLLDRVPSLSLLALNTTVLVQRETGGNLAETLQKISAVLRGRFRFHRRVRTLSAEGRMSAWILGLVPFVMFALLALTTPDYAMVLVNDPMGRKLVGVALALLVIGNLWLSKLLRIEV